MSVVRLYALAKKRKFAAWRWESRVASLVFRIVFIALLFAWPIVTAIIAFRGRGKRLARWNNLVNEVRVFFSESWSRGARVAGPLDCTDFLAPLMYIYRRTGHRIPDRKDETIDCCRRLGIPTPRVLAAGDEVCSGQAYVVKPIDGCRAFGIRFTDEPRSYVRQTDVIVQEVARNSLSLRRLWGTNTLGCLRFITAINDDDDYEVLACILRVPIGDSTVDNTCKGNGYAAVDRRGVLQRLFTDKGSGLGYSHHPTTGEPFEGVTIAGYSECADLAVAIHRALGAGMPVLNADIALTDDGPTLIEINRAPGQYEQMYRDGYSEKCVRAICRIVQLVHNDVAEWLRMSNRTVEDDFTKMPRKKRRPGNVKDACLAEHSTPAIDRERTVSTAGPV
jgi:hypothetical protein